VQVIIQANIYYKTPHDPELSATLSLASSVAC